MNTELNTNEENLDGQDDITIESENVEVEDSKEEKEEEKPSEADDGKPGTEDTPVEEGTKEIDPVQKRINKVIYERKLAEEKLAESTRIADEFKKKYEEATAEVLPDVPEVPDIMDSEYYKKMEARDLIIAKHAQSNAVIQANAERQQEEAQRVHQEETNRVVEMVKSFDKRAEELKIEKAELDGSQEKVGRFLQGKSELCKFLLSDEDGPLNVLYLSQNIAELEKISKMPETTAAVYIAKNISVEAAKLKPKTTTAPEPHYIPKGKGKAEDVDPNEEGTIYS